MSFLQRVYFIRCQSDTFHFTWYVYVFLSYSNQFVGILVNGDETGCIGSSVQVQFRHPSHVSRLTEVLLVLFREDVPEIGPFQFRFLADTVDTQTDLPVRHGDE